MPKKVYVDSEACIGCTLCTQISEKIFVMKDDGKSATLSFEVDEAQIPEVQTAIDACPVSCIHWKE